MGSPVITQNSGGKEAPPPASPSYSVGRTYGGHESRFCWFGSFGSDQNLVGPSKAFSRTEKSSSSAEEPETSVKDTSGINQHLGLRAVLTRPAGAADEQCRSVRPQRHRTVPRVTDGEDGGLYVRLLGPENGPEEVLLQFLQRPGHKPELTSVTRTGSELLCSRTFSVKGSGSSQTEGAPEPQSWVDRTWSWSCWWTHQTVTELRTGSGL